MALRNVHRERDFMMEYQLQKLMHKSLTAAEDDDAEYWLRHGAASKYEIGRKNSYSEK